MILIAEQTTQRKHKHCRRRLGAPSQLIFFGVCVHNHRSYIVCMRGRGEGGGASGFANEIRRRKSRFSLTHSRPNGKPEQLDNVGLDMCLSEPNFAKPNLNTGDSERASSIKIINDVHEKKSPCQHRNIHFLCALSHLPCRIKNIHVH